MRVRVYRNLKHGRQAPALYSIMELSTRRVIGTLNRVVVEDAKFIVSEAGRQRVLREKRKNVHAFVEGTFVPDGAGVVEQLPVRVTYNPYVAGEFQIANPGEWAGTAIACAKKVLLDGTGITAEGVD